MRPAAISRVPVPLIRQWPPWEVIAFLVALAVYDLWATRRTNAATLAVAGLICVYLFGCTPLGHTAGWHVVARWMQSWKL